MCEDVLLLTIFNILNKIIVIAKIVIPLIIIVTGMLEFFKVVTSGSPDSVTKSLMGIFYKFVAAVLIFFLPSIVGLVMGLNGSYDESNVTCLLNANDKTLSDAKIKRATEAVEEFEQNLVSSEYMIANRYVSHVTDENKKAELEERLKNAKKAMNSLSEKKRNASKNAAIKAAADKAAKEATVSGVSAGGVDNVFNLPYYNQCEEAYLSMSTSAGNYKTCEWGCGYVALSMIADGLTGSKGGPPAVIKALYPHMKGTAMPDSAMETRNVSQFGLTSTMLFPRKITQSSDELSRRKQAVVNALQNGYAVELLTPGHFITLAGITNGKITVLDPGHREKNGNFTIDEIVNRYPARSGQTGFVTAYGFKKK